MQFSWSFLYLLSCSKPGVICPALPAWLGMAGMGPEARKEMGPRPPSLPPPPCPVRTSLSSRILGNCTAHKLRVDTDTAVCATLRTNTIWVMGRKAQIEGKRCHLCLMLHQLTLSPSFSLLPQLFKDFEEKRSHLPEIFWKQVSVANYKLHLPQP